MSKINSNRINQSKEKVFSLTFGTAALNIKLVIEYGEEFVTLELIVNVVSSRLNVNMIRRPFLSMAVMGGIVAKKIQENEKANFMRNEIYHSLNDSLVNRYRKVNLLVD